MKQIHLHTTNHIKDEKLAQLFIKNNDKKAFERLYTRHFKSLSKYIGWLSNDLSLGQDIAQSVMLRFYEDPAAFDSSRNFKVWLFSSAKNQWKNELRHYAVKNKYQSLMIVVEDAIEEESEEQKLKKERIEKAMNGLSENHREVFVLKYSNNLSISEIGEVCSCSEGTVKSRLFYAMKQIKETVKSMKEVI